jgi:Fis family transcriptional regulator, factor for inversion stimulation protein
MVLREQLERLVQALLASGIPYDDALREFEKRFILQALEESDGNLGRAAARLGIHRNTLSRKVAAYRRAR